MGLGLVDIDDALLTGSTTAIVARPIPCPVLEVWETKA
jgi:hypothetical protein